MKTIHLYSVVMLTFILCGCARKSGSEEEEGGSVKATVAVRVTTLRRGDMATVVSAVGKVDALRKQKLFSPVAGRITSVNALEGTAVRSGDMVAVIQTKESQAAIAGAEALLRGAKTPEQKVEAQQALDLARASENSVVIRSTFDGIIATRSVSEGEFVAENAELCTLIDQSTLVFVADVPARDLASIHVGQRAAISLQSVSGKEIVGEVEAINPQADVLSQTLKVRLKLVQIGAVIQRELKTDMVGNASIVVGLRKGVFIVPKSAVLRNDEMNSYSVVTFAADSLARSMPIEVTGMTDSTVAITNHGLKEGMSIITEGNYALADSTHITVVQ